MPWYKVTLSRERILAGDHIKLMDACGAIIMARRDKDAAIFTTLMP